VLQKKRRRGQLDLAEERFGRVCGVAEEAESGLVTAKKRGENATSGMSQDVQSVSN
jgi:hypothetical protein